MTGKFFSFLCLIFLIGVLFPFSGCTKKAASEITSFSVIYTSTVLGEIEPCG